MAEVNNFNPRKRKVVIDLTKLFPTDDSVDNRQPDHAIPSARESNGRVGVVKQQETEWTDIEYQLKTDDELDEMSTRINKFILTLGHKLPDNGDKLKASLRRCVAEVARRRRSPFDKDEREEDDDVKRMRRLRDELEAEKKQGIEVKGKLMDAETKIVHLKARIYDLQEKLRDTSVQLDAAEKDKKELAKRLNVSERKCETLADDSKWLLQEGLPFSVQKLVNESSKENLMTVSELRALYQRFMSDSS